MTTHKITRGFDLRLAGAAEPKLQTASEPARVAVETAEFPGIKPKALVKEGDPVTTGQPLFLDKLDRDLVWCAPASGRVAKVEFGERRFLLRVVIENAAAGGGKETFAGLAKPTGDRAAIVKAIKGAGLWPLFRQRPVGKIVRGDTPPVAIFVNGMDSAPLAADPAFAVQGRKADLQAGVDLLQKLLASGGKVCLALRAAGDHQSDLRDLKGVEVHDFSGPHPAGLVGTHISRIRPLKPGEIAYTLRVQDLARLGEWARTGKYPAQTVINVAGSAATTRGYYRVRQGATVATVTGGKPIQGDVRVIDGNVLHGRAIAADGHLGYYCAGITVIPEGTGARDLFGWALPQFGKLSFSRSVLSWLLPKQEYVVDARLNGGHRPIVNIGAWERVTALDIYPAYLVRAIQANDIEEAVKLGLLEVTEEDVALCTFVDPCKIDVGKIVRQGLDLYEKEG
ncbi:MAG: Na(+)-translocating NADH-quinone reductase subunit A [Planctomycetes bacterium]|nr:Na(+)-translocating NADH-quinone reductase subunit A [Planctomycetota bacterium]